MSVVSKKDLFLCAILAVALVACGEAPATPTEAPTPMPAATATPTVPASPEESEWDDREVFENYLCELGFVPRAAITGKTRYLITGEGAGPKKIEKAKVLNVQILDEAEFFQLING